jgi:hypothetical protein
MIRYLCSSYMDSNCYERIFQCKYVLMLLDAANPAYMCALCFLSRDAIETGVLFGSLNDSAFFFFIKRNTSAFVNRCFRISGLPYLTCLLSSVSVRLSVEVSRLFDHKI